MDVDHDDLFARHADEILAFLARRTLDAQAALDLTGETFAVAWESRRRFRGSDAQAARAWLFGIARNLLHAYIRRGYAERRAMARLGVDPVELSPESHARIEELAGLAALRQAVAAEVERLPAGQRDALVLRVVDELSFEQVAARLEITPENARVRVSRAVRALHARLGDVG